MSASVGWLNEPQISYRSTVQSTWYFVGIYKPRMKTLSKCYKSVQAEEFSSPRWVRPLVAISSGAGTTSGPCGYGKLWLRCVSVSIAELSEPVEAASDDWQIRRLAE